jgi:hypothetical protein
MVFWTAALPHQPQWCAFVRNHLQIQFFSPPTKNKKSLKTAELQRKEANNGNSGNL